MNVTLRQLQVFLAVAATRNFSRTGSQIGLTQPAVSRSITELEAQLGLQLLNRTTREVELTDAGQRLAARLPRVLEDLEATLLDVRGMATALHGRVRVASSPTLSANLLPDCIARCQRDLPGVQIVLLDRIQNDVLASVLSGEVDFGVVIDPREREALRSKELLGNVPGLIAAAEPVGGYLLVAKHLPGAGADVDAVVAGDHERLGVGVRSTVKKGLCGAFFHNLPKIHHKDAAAQKAHHGKIVRNKQVGGAKLLLHVTQQVERLRLHRGIKG